MLNIFPEMLVKKIFSYSLSVLSCHMKGYQNRLQGIGLHLPMKGNDFTGEG
jgi:hypothetical protein